MKVPFLVIGGGLSGIAAAIRAARFIPDVVLIEQHSRLGGLNSYFYRNKVLYETGLHAITNYSEANDKRAPLNRLLRQLKLKRSQLSFCQQHESKILFPDNATLSFSNDFDALQESIAATFPQAQKGMEKLLGFLQQFDPFVVKPFRSAKSFLTQTLGDSLLADMLLCPLMYYGSCHENDMDLSQFAIMFRAIYLEGMFRPNGTIKDFLETLKDHFVALGGTLRLGAPVKNIIHSDNQAHGVLLENGEELECDNIISTIGHYETLKLLGRNIDIPSNGSGRLGFVENIFRLPSKRIPANYDRTTIIFYNRAKTFRYQNPQELVDHESGVICFPSHFQNLPLQDFAEIRTTHLANYSHWRAIRKDSKRYNEAKKNASLRSLERAEEIIGRFSSHIVYGNSFTPITIENYTGKIAGAIYGSPEKIKNGDIGFTNLFLAGTDQGFLGIVGSMLSGVSVTNQHILPRL